MPLYFYQALDSKGKKKSGYLETENFQIAKEKIREQGLLLVQLSEQTKRRRERAVKREKLLTFTLQFSQLIGAKVPVYESLVAIERQYREEPLGQILANLCEQIKSGVALSKAMRQFPRVFDSLYCAMIAAGESVGSLDLVLERLSEQLHKQSQIKKEIITAMIYPSILACFSLVVIMLLLGFVVPSIEGIFEGQELNNFTRAILSLSHFFRGYWWLYLPVLVATVFIVYWRVTTLAGKKWLEKVGLRLPIVKTLMIQTALARFSRTMATLLKGGLPLVDSLQIAKGVSQCYALEEEIGDFTEKIIEGSNLSKELLRSKWFPRLITQMVTVGEETGSLDTMLSKVADLYEDDLKRTIARFLAMAQPTILILMGVVIGAVLLAVLLPMMSLSALTI